ncbi:sensor/response regulator hybrid [Alcanivorax nanhaiticus]|uniref:histidine kinase n=1 Tax=Alcanivorax nanhaiticus TaxID=1177154 RepID=A0A095TWC6_9GAMM|nr:response regulator [Alcanivorax nanhaiticus]KGD66648.1 sensor/response regulator hybrid [Alcanivorax nanhaiticus]
MANRSLHSRLMLMAILPAALAALVVGGYALISHLLNVQDSNASRQQLLADSFAAQLESMDHRDTRSQQTLLHRLLEEQDVRAASLIFDDNRPHQHAGPRLLPTAGATLDNDGRLDTGSSWQIRRPINPGSPATLTIEFSRQGQYISVLESLVTLILITLGVLLLAMIPALRFGRQLTRPIHEMVSTVQRIRDGDLNMNINTQALGELAQLETALRQMVVALDDAQTELQQNVDQATQDLRETLETIEIQNIELDMARKEALKASQIKSEFLANMSHEIRTPLNGILGFTKLLGRSSMTPRQQDYLSTIHKSADSLLAIINDILDFSKIEAGKLSLEHTPLNLHDLIEDVQTMLAPMAQDRGLEQAAIIYSDVPLNLLGDPQRIRQVLTNLISNAIKFTDTGSVVVRAMLEENRGAEAVIKMTVTDTGNGLSADQQKSLFNAFTQADQSARRQEGGTGLGLAISKRLVEGMGGEIGIESSEGKGSTFWFTLRAERDPKQRPSMFTEELKHKTVTLVETDEYGRLGLYHMLSHWQMEIREHHSLAHLMTAADKGELANSDFLVVGVPNLNTTPDLQQQVDDLAALGRPMLVLSNNPETVSRWLEDLPHCQVQGKPATRQRLLNALLALAGEEGSESLSLAPALQLHQPVSVMVVDDHPGNLKLARVFLEELGADVTACESGASALEAFQQDDFDLVFMDIQMPGMDGKTTTARMRSHETGTRHTPIVALTAHALESERRDLLDSGLDDYLSKPISEKQLRYTLEKWVLKTTKDDLIQQPEEPEVHKLEVFDAALARRRAGGREALANEMMSMLLDSLVTDRPAISSAFDSGDDETLLERVHKLHGATRYCGTPRLEQAAKALEEALKTGNGRDILGPLVATLCDEICALEHYCQAPEVSE